MCFLKHINNYSSYWNILSNSVAEEEVVDCRGLHLGQGGEKEKDRTEPQGLIWSSHGHVGS